MTPPPVTAFQAKVTDAWPNTPRVWTKAMNDTVGRTSRLTPPRILAFLTRGRVKRQCDCPDENDNRFIRGSMGATANPSDWNVPSLAQGNFRLPVRAAEARGFN